MRVNRWVCAFMLFLLCVSSTALASNEKQPEWLVEQYGQPVLMAENADVYDAGITICFFPGEGIVVLYKLSDDAEQLKAWEVVHSDALERYVANAQGYEPIKTVCIDFSDMSAKQYPNNFTATSAPNAEQYGDYKAFLKALSPNAVIENNATATAESASVVTDFTEWPCVDFQSISISLDSNDERVLAYIAPDHKSASVGGYKAKKVAKYTALFREGNYIYCDAIYSGVKRRCIYFNSAYVVGKKKVATISFDKNPGTLTNACSPRLGPGVDYELYDKISLEKGLEVNVCTQLGDWLFIEYPYSFVEGKRKYEGMGRGWVELNAVTPR